MIRVDKDFVIQVDVNNYVACVDLHRIKVDKKGKESNDYLTIGFYSTLENALQGILEYKMKKLLSENEVTLEQAIRDLKGVRDEFKELVKGIAEE